MADPYTDVTVSNYNLNPPADDGSRVPANEITWAKGKEKLSDPLKTAIEAVNTNVGTAVDKLSGGITAVVDDYTVLASDQGKVVKISVAGKTITTPTAATVGAPFKWGLLNTSTGDVTLDGHSTETVDGALTVTIPAGRGVVVDTDGTNWFTEGQNWPEAVVTAKPMFPPTGRLTISSGVPVITADTLAQATVYYTPYIGAAIMLYDGTAWKAYTFAELSQALSDTTKSPAAAGASAAYDMFVWLDSTTVRCTRGPAWTTPSGASAARGTGGGTTELVRVNGVLMNANAISNGPAAQRGVWVGTISTDGSNQLNMKMNPAAAAGGGACRLDVWNMYNRIAVQAVSKDSTDTWAYSTNTWRSANNNTANRITAVFGLAEDAVTAVYAALTNGNAAGNIGYASVGLDVTNAPSGYLGSGNISTVSGAVGGYSGVPGLGQHFFQALEYATGGTVNWYGDNGAPTVTQMALTLQARM